jgi:hypothetical protein
MTTNTFAGTQYKTPKAMIVALVSEFVSAGGRNNRKEVESYLQDLPSCLEELKSCWDLDEGQRELLAYYFEEGRLEADDVLRCLYYYADVHDYKTGRIIGWVDEEGFTRYLDLIESEIGVVEGERFGFDVPSIYMEC